MKTFKKIIEELTKREMTIATMESCSGGGISNAITNCEGASEVFKFGAVTYSNDYKITMGVDPEVIKKYSVYSIETAHEMALKIAAFTNSDIGIGITGKLNRADRFNNFGKDNEVFVSILYDGEYYDIDINVDQKTRKQNKDVVIDKIIEKLGEILWPEK